MPVFTRIARAVAGASLVLALLPLQAHAQSNTEPSYGPELEGFQYPAPTQQYRFKSQGVDLQMTYMDVKPAKANGKTVVLLHGKNFCGATWEGTTRELTKAGYRVVVPDQIGFCKSTKPAHYQYTFQQLADNTSKLLASIGVTKAIVVGHSTGGMLATRYALMYPQATEQLVMINPIGLEDWKNLGVPSLGVDKWYQRELNTSAERVREYERTTYYNGQWKPEYETWVQMLVGMVRGKGKEVVAWNSALIYDMIYTQPVVHEFRLIKVPTFLLMGLKDTTAIGKDAAPEAVRPKLGNYTVLAEQTRKAIPGAVLVTFPEMGHAPQMQDPVQFHKALLKGLVR
jgi:pimeloyl-ACP methyl ester carboxylesterase